MSLVEELLASPLASLSYRSDHLNCDLPDLQSKVELLGFDLEA